MNNQKAVQPLYCNPMPQEEFYNRNLVNQQYLLLNSTDMQKEEIRNNWSMMRDEKKSYLRMMECENKQIVKAIVEDLELFHKDGIVYIKTNGLNNIVKKNTLFSCHIKNVNKFTREGEPKKFWFQLEIIDIFTNELIKSELYDDSILSSTKKLKNTILRKYDNTVSNKDAQIGWSAVIKHIFNELEKKESMNIPSHAGWYNMNDEYHLWSANDSESVFLTDEMLNFVLKKSKKVDLNAAIQSLINFGTEKIAALLMIRLKALLGILINPKSESQEVLLIGENARKCAENICSSFISDFAIGNLDSDRINVLKKKIMGTFETPVILLSNYADSRSSENRFVTVQSWLYAGICDGRALRSTVIFCLNTLAKNFPLDEIVTIDVTEVNIDSVGENIDVLQNYIIDEIEDKWKYYIPRMKEKYEKYKHEGSSENESILYTIADFIVTALETSYEFDKSYFEKFIKTGISILVEQPKCVSEVIVEKFRDGVKELAHKKSIVFRNRLKAYSYDIEKTIFWDDDNYYFRKEVLKTIAENINISEKSLLKLKQSLAENGVIKLYQNRNGRNREFSVDFMIVEETSKTETMSGIAINRDFFESFGEIPLYMKGGE